MNKVFRLFLFFSLASSISGCASRLVSSVNVDPNFTRPSGDRVFIAVKGLTTKNEMVFINETILGKRIIFYANEWFTQRGYRVVGTDTHADTIVYFSPQSKTREINVPGGTTTIPVFGNLGSGTTSTIKNSYGEEIGSVHTQSSDPLAVTDYKTEYHEGYTSLVTDRWLFFSLNKVEYGKWPFQVVEGRVYPEKFDQEFFENDSVLRNAVFRILDDSTLRNAAGLKSTGDGLTICYPKLGVKLGDSKVTTAGPEIVSINSNLKNTQFKVGDVILQANGSDMPHGPIPSLRENTEAHFIVIRAGKKIEVTSTPVIGCLGE